ncbi:MAG: NAD(P)-dependent oxidoreductase, partial [Mesorhizobium sp.]
MPSSKRKVLITGAGGALGSLLVRAFRDGYQLRVATRERRDDDLFEGLEAHYASLADLETMEVLCRGIDTVVHLGGRSLEDSWDAKSPALAENLLAETSMFRNTRNQWDVGGA